VTGDGALPPAIGPERLVVVAVDPDGVERPVGEAGLDVELRVGAAETGWAVELAVTARTGFIGAVRVVAELTGADDPWWLVPGVFYGENRPADNDRAFPRFEIGARSPAQHDALVADAWDVRADRAATPAVFAWPSPGAPGAALAAAETSAVGMTGVGFAHDGDRAILRLTFPVRESPVSYDGSATPRAAEVRVHRFAAGERLTIPFRLFALPADRHAYAPVLRALHAEAAPASPLEPWVGVAEAADLAAEGLLRWHYDPDPGVLLETVGFDREVTGRDGRSVDRQAMHVGWVSGAPWAYALLAHGVRTGRDDEVVAARRVLDFLTAELSPSGTLWGVWYRDRGWSQSWTRYPRGLHSRTLGEATLFLVRALRLVDDAGWRHAARSDLDAVVARQRADGDLGAVHDAVTGEVLAWEGAAGLAWIPALVEAAGWDDRYLPAAIAAGDRYARYVEAESIAGAPEDVDRAPTSEDGYSAVMAYTALHRATGAPRFLDLARRAADWMLTFRYSYDVDFAPTTLLGRYGFRTRGADQASPSNQHLHAYGLVCTDELRELSRAVGDPWYADRADETLACFRQFVAREDGDFNAYRGMVSERYYQTACFQPKGMLLTLSHAWSVGVLLLACEGELGGLA